MGWTSPETRELFNWFVRCEAAKRGAQRNRLINMIRTIPTSEQVIDELRSLTPENFERVMRLHPGFKLHRNLKSIESMLEVFRCAVSDLKIAIAEFPALAIAASKVEQEALESEVAIRVNKELLAAVSASQALVDYSRRVKGRIDPRTFSRKQSEIFDPNEHALVKDLRNILAHQVHSEAAWQTIYSRRGRLTRFKFNVEDLLVEAELSSASKIYLSSHTDELDVSEFLSRYATRVELFYAWFLTELNGDLPPSVEDYRNCQVIVKRHHARLSYRFLVGIWMQVHVNPYDHLSKHLNAAQLSVALSLPHHSAEQVDYIISCLDRDGVCDVELRKLVYELFKVPDTATRHSATI